MVFVYNFSLVAACPRWGIFMSLRKKIEFLIYSFNFIRIFAVITV